jgi:hypothetical protein
MFAFKVFLELQKLIHNAMIPLNFHKWWDIASHHLHLFAKLISEHLFHWFNYMNIYFSQWMWEAWMLVWIWVWNVGFSFERDLGGVNVGYIWQKSLISTNQRSCLIDQKCLDMSTKTWSSSNNYSFYFILFVLNFILVTHITNLKKRGYYKLGSGLAH